MATNATYNSAQDSFQSDHYAIFTAINEWERHSIGKIQLAAEQARSDFQRLLDKRHDDIVNLLINMKNSVSQNSMVDMSLNHLTAQLHRFREELSSSSSTIYLEHDKSLSPIHLITLSSKANNATAKNTLNDLRTINVPGTQLLTLGMLCRMTPLEQKQILGERLFVLVQQIEPKLAAKITGMFLEFDIKYVLLLIKSNATLKEKVKEAIDMLRARQREASYESQPKT
ncbi:unnamed protein product [Adineta ricciae]|uniref:PABC domain-containing protein n=1 Tax=Adineta ricciae TaxID=249248 RepID=A0A813PSX5_ADIRI|nr:unnamed protein product [Adineta ricciae]